MVQSSTLSLSSLGELMFIVETSSAPRKRNRQIWMGVLFLMTASFGALLTMHVSVRPSIQAPHGFRILGFPRRPAVAPTTTARPLLWWHPLAE